LPTPAIEVYENGLIKATVTNDRETKTNKLFLETKAAETITPGTNNKTVVSKGKYTTGDVTVVGDADLKAANIKKGVNIFNITGTYGGMAEMVGGELLSVIDWLCPNYSPKAKYDLVKVGDIVIGYIGSWELFNFYTNKDMYVEEIRSEFKPASTVFVEDFSRSPFYEISSTDEIKNYLIIGQGRITDKYNNSFPVMLKLTSNGKIYMRVIDRNKTYDTQAGEINSTSNLRISFAYSLKPLISPTDSE
jgi:hypothetical protein